MENYTLTLFEACEVLSKSRKSIGRYIRKGLLHPREIKSVKGVLEYRFSEEDLKAFKEREEIARQEKQDTISKTPYPAQHGNSGDNVLNEATKNETGLPGHNGTSGTVESGTTKTEAPTINRENILSEPRNNETGRYSEPGIGVHPELVELLKETTGLLKEQLTKKDGQIAKLNETVDSLVERNREMNILLKGLQDKVLMLEQPRKEKQPKPRPAGTEKKEPKPKQAEAKPGFFSKLFQ